jgi:hypothetical protein
VSQEVDGPIPKDRPQDQVATKQLDELSISAAASAYLVLLVGRSGNYLRRPYRSLHSAQQALQRAQKRGQVAYLVLCELRPVAVADLGEVAE